MRTDLPTLDVLIVKKNDPTKSEPTKEEAELEMFKYDVTINTQKQTCVTINNKIVENQAAIYYQNSQPLRKHDKTHVELKEISQKLDQIVPKKTKFDRAVVDRDPSPNAFL